MVYNPTGRTTRQFATGGVVWAGMAVIMTVLALQAERTSTVVIAWVSAGLAACLAIASAVAIVKLRNADEAA